ncbi:MAG TPA: hypothetical protein VG518_00755, partial [Solirubrobacterales bacterium]|nr:hypothetical protein [Solirubrobacterales bacterium]
GGGGEKKTLRLVARYADACNLFGSEPDVIGHKLDVLRGHCEAEGRDYAEIEKTVIYNSGNPLDDLDGFLSRMDALAKLGIDKVWVSNRVPDPPSWAAELCERTVGPLAELG